MSCLDPQAVARAATSELPVPHLGECVTCRRVVEEQRAIRGLVQQLPAPALTRAHRQRLAAEVLASADQLPAPRRRSPVVVIGGALAAAAALVVWVAARPAVVAVAPQLGGALASVDHGPGARAIAMLDVPPPLGPAEIESTSPVIHDGHGAREVVTLTDGTVTLDTRTSRDADVRVGATVVHVDTARVRVHVRQGAILSVQVIAGSVEVETPTRRMLVAPETVWFAEPAPEQLAVRAFRDGWIALRAGRNALAITLFDRATDRAVAEDAAYWAAVAAVRAGDRSAAPRLAAFVRAFPGSPHAAQAQQFLAGVTR